jgi:chromosomal replication initiator protein
MGSDRGVDATGGEIMLIHDVIKNVAVHYGVSRAVMIGRSRTKPVVLVRGLAAYIARDVTGRSFQEIAKQLNRDHTTIIYLIRKIDQMRKYDAEFDAEIAALTDSVKSNGSAS